MTVSTQKIVAVLRKAGMPIARYHTSSMVRGWSSLSQSGYRVRKLTDLIIRISYDTRGNFSESATAAKLNAAKDVLSAAGISSEVNGTFLEVKV
jgi:hypothetical protein